MADRLHQDASFAPAIWSHSTLEKLYNVEPTFGICNSSLLITLTKDPETGYWMRGSFSEDRTTRIFWMRVVITQLPNSRQRPRAATISDLMA